jgi:hypothetical protein
MSILSSLGSLVSFLPIPGAGIIGKGLSAAGDVGSVLGKQQAGNTAGKISQANLNQEQDRNALANYIAQQNAQNTAANTDLQRKSFESSNRSTSAKQALIGALLGGGLTPTTISGGKASGGLLESLNRNPDAMAAMKLLASQGSQAQQTPLQFQGGQMVAPPKLTTLPQVDQGGVGSNIANILQLLGSLSSYAPSGDRQQAALPGLPQAGSGMPSYIPGEARNMPEEIPQQLAALQNPNIYKSVRF